MMRPFVFADRWKADRREVLKLFLHSAQAGLLDMSWDVICPGCRGAKERHATLKNLREQAHCNACNIRYTADFAQSVEVTFRPNPAIRPIQVARYCSGGPINAPHVLAQQRIPARRSKTLKMTLSPWRYYLRSPKLSKQTLVTVQPDSTVSSAIVRIHRPTLEPETLEIAREVALTFENNDDKEVVVMLERAAGRENAATAAMVIAMNEFRTLFSEEVLSPETAISIGAVTLMFTDLKASTKLYETLGEAPAYALVRRHFDLLRNCIANNEGAVVKTIGDAVMAAFMDPARALAAALAMHRTINDDNAARGEPLLTLKIGIHYGACIAVNLNDTLDYFGTAANIAARVQKESLGGDVVITQEVWADPAVQELLAETPHRYETCEVVIRGLSGARKVFRIQPYLKMTIEH
jgi:class 3 adenylate cyclase